MNYFLSRLCARVFDYSIFYLVGVFLSLALPTEFSENFYYVYALATPLLWAPLEAIMMSLWGTTLGKMVFGVIVRTAKGEKLPMEESFRRAFFLGKRPGVLHAVKIRSWKFLLLALFSLGCGSSLFLGKDISEVAIGYEQSTLRGNWIDYTSELGNFTIQFPKSPQTETQVFPLADSDQPLELNEVKVESGETFSVSYLEMPQKWRFFSEATLLKGALNVVVEHTPGAKLIDKKRVTHKSHQALDFHFQEGSKVTFGRLVIVGKNLYKITVTYPQDTPNKEQYEAFLASFDLKGA